MIKKLLPLLKSNLWIAVCFGVLFILALGMQLYGGEPIKSLGGNLVAEFIGALVTVFGIDYLIQRRENQRLLPVKAASYEDVRLMTHWALDIWKDAYLNAVGDSAPTSWRDLYSEENLNKLLANLDVSKPANVFPAKSWGDHIFTVLFTR